MPKFNFISNIEEISGQTTYQVYEAEVGFERAFVLVPISNVEDFEKKMEGKTFKSLVSLSKIVESVGGVIE